ncbi:unnamed protein product [Pleuronectes platessa]|uniref:Uncharacterized protein n=1 Tax=Pleuronectes platessa TaxID=8262 RepID=A0A9N7Z7Q3_PLEPL|nr:unnamed protein product [Pleuronectes platessa]
MKSYRSSVVVGRLAVPSSEASPVYPSPCGTPASQRKKGAIFEEGYGADLLIGVTLRPLRCEEEEEREGGRRRRRRRTKHHEEEEEEGEEEGPGAASSSELHHAPSVAFPGKHDALQSAPRSLGLFHNILTAQAGSRINTFFHAHARCCC